MRHRALLLLIGWAAPGITLAVLPGVSAQAGWEVMHAAVLLGLLAAVLRPAFAATSGSSTSPAYQASDARGHR
ncbi:hypothetical protein BJF90_02425 [Pseudonocardia sp. CNS-004]|nr:hypothetical protein BJF90_02425 [Pseudonocardia sp. CNS-004]